MGGIITAQCIEHLLCAKHIGLQTRPYAKVSKCPKTLPNKLEGGSQSGLPDSLSRILSTICCHMESYVLMTLADERFAACP